MKKLLALTAALLAGSLSISNAALVGYWNFNDGTPSDSSGNGNNGSFVPHTGTATTSVDTPDGSPFSASFAATGHVQVPDTNNTLDIATAMTITAWVKPAGGTAWDGVVAKAETPGSNNNFPGNYELRLGNGNNMMEFLWEDTPNTAPAVNDTSAATAGQWNHIAVTVASGGTYQYYINGVATGGGAMPATFGNRPNDNPLYIGNRADFATGAGTTNFDGLIDEVAIWNEQLSAAQINDIFVNGVPEPSTALLGVLAAMGFVVRRRR